MNADEVLKILDELAEKLTPTAQYAFEIVANRVLAEGLLGTAVALAFMAVIVVANVIAARIALKNIRETREYNANKEGYYRRDNDLTYFGWGIFGAFSAFLSFLALSFLYENLLTLFSLEYSTVIRIIEAAGGVV